MVERIDLIMKEKWYTLAVSNIGTHKMQFKNL